MDKFPLRSIIRVVRGMTQLSAIAFKSMIYYTTIFSKASLGVLETTTGKLMLSCSEANAAKYQFSLSFGYALVSLELLAFQSY